MDIAIKYIGPLMFALLWAYYVQRARSVAFLWISLFFTSIAGFSQNFEFIFRQFHQGIQLPMAIMGFLLLTKGKFLNPVGTILLTILGLILLSLLFNGINSDARGQLINFLIAMGVTIFVLSRWKMLPEGQHFLLLRFISMLGVLLALLGIMEFLTLGSRRVEATFANPNYFALFIGVAYCILARSERGFIRLIGLLVIIVAIVLSGSRSALAIPILSHLWMIFSVHSWKERFVRGLIIVLLSGIAMGTTDFRLDREGADASDAERYLFAQIGLEMARENPWFGVGWGQYISKFSYYSHIPEVYFLEGGVVDASRQERRVSHNDYIRIMAELGFPAFILSVILTFWTLLRVPRAEILSHGFLMPIWIGLVLFSITHNNLNTAYFWIFFLMPHLHRYSR